MSRFGNLELDGQHEDLEQTSALKDQAYYMAEARTAHEMANFEKALRYYSKVLEYDPQLTAAWGGQVRMLIELGEYREAKVWAEKALERFPRDPELLAAKGVALGRLGELNEALAFSDASIEERGETAYVWLARADVLLARKESRANQPRALHPLAGPRTLPGGGGHENAGGDLVPPGARSQPGLHPAG